jgi:hypothetical protein
MKHAAGLGDSGDPANHIYMPVRLPTTIEAENGQTAEAGSTNAEALRRA